LTLLTNDCEKHDVIDPYGWYCANSVATYEGANTCPFSNIPSCGLQPVMTKLPNAFGLFDMHGNVSEFTGTLMRQYQDVHEVDPGIDLLFEMGQGIVVRNGQYNTGATKLCSFWRGGPGLDYHSIKAGFIGFRLAQSVQQPD
jgi:formylglycine-generating enzyme required for sulfatase activity